MIRAATVEPLVDSERAIVGLLLFRPSLEVELMASLTEDSFAEPWARAAFTVCAEAHTRGRDITDGLLEVELYRRGIGDRSAIREFLGMCREVGGLTLRSHQEHVGALRDRDFMRRLKARMVASKDADQMEHVVLEEVARRTQERDGGPVPLGSVMMEVAERQHAIASGALKIGYTTGIDELDEHCLIRAGDAHAIVARTGIGKSAFLLSLLRANAINPGLPVDGILFSLEMARDAVAKRYLGLEGRINTRLVDGPCGQAVREQIDKIALENKDVRIEVDGSADLTVADIIARAKHWKRRRRVKHGIVTIDFAQLVRRERDRDENGAEAFQRVAYGLRGFAQSEGLAVVVTAQTNRLGALAEVPQLEHVEGGGGLGRACALVLGLHLPEKAPRPDNEQEIEVRILKNRHGQTGGIVRCRVDYSTGRFF